MLKKTLKMAGKAYPAYKKLLENKDYAPVLLVVAKDENLAEEIFTFLGAHNKLKCRFVSYEDTRSLSLRLVKEIEEADAVLLYTKDFVQEAEDIAYAGYLIKHLTFRYLFLIYGNRAEDFIPALLDTVKVNPCKVKKARSRKDVIDVLQNETLKILPDDALPAFLSLEIFDGIRNRYAVKVILIQLLKLLILLRILPPITLPFLLDQISLIASLFTLIELKDRSFKGLGFVAALLLSQIFGQEEKKRKKKTNHIFNIGLVLAFLASTLAGGLLKNDKEA